VIVTSVPADTIVNDEVADPAKEVATYYLVQVAAGDNFDSLKKISLNAATILGAKFSMLDRIYKPGKGIIVPEDSDDEIDRGEYYPRRPFDDQNFVSVEMSSGYNQEEVGTLKMIALAGMYPLKNQADSVATLLKKKIPTATTIKREIYMGCMH
jgi:hypothetical protein